MIAKGPNILNINAYTQGQDDQSSDYGDNATSSRPIIDSKAIEDQFDNFVKELQKYDQILSSVAKNIDQISSEQQFITDFYPQFIVDTNYEEDEEKKIIMSSDPQLAKVVMNLERANRILKEEMKGWIFQYAKKTKLSETLLTENEILRKAITTKNKEIVKLIECIAHTENDQILQLKEQLSELKEQNGVLLDHLQKIREQLIQKKEDQKALIEALDKSKQTFLEVEKESRQAEDKEEHLSKTVALLEDSLEQMEKRKKKLQKQKERLQQLKYDYNKDQSSIESKVLNCQQDKRQIQRELKTKFETHQQEKNRLIQEIQDSTEKVQKQKQQTRYLENQISRNQRKLQSYNDLNKDLKKSNTENGVILESLRKQFADVVETETKVSSDIDMLNLDIDVLKAQLKKYDKMEEDLQEKQKRQLKFLEETQKQQLAQKQSEQSKINRQLAMKILQERSELSLKEKEIQKWQIKILDKKDEIADLKLQIKEIKNNQLKMSELRQKIREEERRRS